MENTHKTSRKTRSDETFMRSRKNENYETWNQQLSTTSGYNVTQYIFERIPNSIFEVGSGVGELQNHV